MLLTLNVGALKQRLQGLNGHPKLKLTDAPAFARQEIGVNGLVLSTDLLVGADRPMLHKVLEAADKAGCPILVLMELTPHPLGSEDVVTVEAATERCLRVAQAAHWLGCSAFSITIDAPDDDETLANVAANLKPISRRAEKLDMNLCLAPYRGLTSTPERVTEVLKKIGGFRVGTLPDFSAASVSADAVQYLRRLVPYASAVLIPVPDELPPLDAVPAKKSLALPKLEEPGGAAKSAKAEKPKAAGKKSKAKGDAPPAESAASEAAVMVAKAPSKGAAGKAGTNYDLMTYVGVLDAVGYEGPFTLDYRGNADPVPALVRSRDILNKVLAEPVAEDSGLSALLAAVDGADGADELSDEDGAGADEE
ncbi:MAG: TIM barrel protein [Phycisphaerales bacterium]|nr:TIM barrel protein [Phycisphaerales bacterium]